MKKQLLVIAVLLFAALAAAELFPQTEEPETLNANINPGPVREVVRFVPEWDWEVDPVNLMENYADYFQCYNDMPIALQPEDHGNGIYMIYRVKDYSSASQLAFSYVNEAGDVYSNEIWGNENAGYYPDAEVDQQTGDCFYCWHKYDDDGSFTYDCYANYDLYHIIWSCGLWKEPAIKVLDSDVLNYLDPTDNDEFIWPQLKIGPSPDPDKQRIYVVASNHNESDGNVANPSENVFIMYADFEQSDLDMQSDLDWSYNSVPTFDNWNAEEPNYYRPFKSFTVIDNQLIFMGYKISDSDNQEESELFCLINDNYGEGDNWQEYYQSAVYEQANPSWEENGYLWYLYADNYTYPQGPPAEPFEDVRQEILHSSHFNVIPTHNNSCVSFPAMMGITFNYQGDPGQYYPLWFQFYPKMFTFDLMSEEFHLTDVYPPDANPYNELPVEPWDLNRDGEIDEFIEEPYRYPTWAQDWPVQYHDHGSAFYYNQYFLAANQEEGWLAYLWVDGTNVARANEGVAGYESWIDKTELAVCISNDWGLSWRDPIFINANSDSPNFDPAMQDMIPCYAYPAPTIEDDGDGWGILHLFFLDDNDYGSYHSQMHGLNLGSNYEYAALRINFCGLGDHQYGDIDDNGEVEAYDAALILSCSVGIDPMPEIDPLPWEEWRCVMADVTCPGVLDAYDAAVVLSFVMGYIEELPWNPRAQEAPEAQLEIVYRENCLEFYATGDFYSATLDLDINLDNAQVEAATDLMYMKNGSRLALASSRALSGKVLTITSVSEPQQISGTVNSQNNAVSFQENAPGLVSCLMDNWPNPFNPSTTIKYNLADQELVNITIYNVRGQKVEELINQRQEAGQYSISWKADNCPSGFYFLKFHTSSANQTRKMILLK